MFHGLTCWPASGAGQVHNAPRSSHQDIVWHSLLADNVATCWLDHLLIWCMFHIPVVTICLEQSGRHIVWCTTPGLVQKTLHGAAFDGQYCWLWCHPSPSSDPCFWSGAVHCWWLVHGGGYPPPLRPALVTSAPLLSSVTDISTGVIIWWWHHQHWRHHLWSSVLHPHHEL